MINRKRQIAVVPHTDPILSSIDIPFDDGFISEKQEQSAQPQQPLKETHHSLQIPNETYVETEYKNKRFTFLDKDKNSIGYFSIDDIAKYVCMKSCSDFMKEIDNSLAINTIEKYIGTNTIGSMQLHSHMVSPFMANVDTVAKLYIFLMDFQDTDLAKYTKLLDEQQQKLVSNVFVTFMYEYSFYFLQLISIVMHKEQTPDASVSNILFQYACVVFMQLTKLSKKMTEDKMSNILTLQTELTNVTSQIQQTSEKLNALQQSIDKQSIKMDIIFEHLFRQHDVTSSATSSASENDSINNNLSEIISLRGNLSECMPSALQHKPPEPESHAIRYLSDTPNVLVIE